MLLKVNELRGAELRAIPQPRVHSARELRGEA